MYGQHVSTRREIAVYVDGVIPDHVQIKAAVSDLFNDFLRIVLAQRTQPASTAAR